MFKRSEKPYSDTEFIAGLKGDPVQRERWTQRLLQQFGGYVFQGMKKFNISKEAAKDAYSDAIIAVVQQVSDGRFRGDSKISTYLYRIFSNYCIKQFRKEERQPIWTEHIPNLPDAARNRLDELIVSEDISQLYQWLDQLGKNCKQILTLRDFNNYSPDQIAKVIGFKSGKSVSSKRHRCLQRLKELIHNIPQEIHNSQE